MPLQSYIKRMVATLDPNNQVESNDVESALHDQQKADSSLKMIVECISHGILSENEKEPCHLILSCHSCLVKLENLFNQSYGSITHITPLVTKI